MMNWRGYRAFDPFKEFARMTQDMQQATGGHYLGQAGSGVFPPLNVYDDGESFMVTAEIPGIDPQQIEIQATATSLTLKGERKRPEESGKRSYHRLEREFGTFNRSLSLPTQVNPDKIKAFYKNGVLEIMLPKADEAKARSITIEN